MTDRIRSGRSSGSCSFCCLLDIFFLFPSLQIKHGTTLPLIHTITNTNFATATRFFSFFSLPPALISGYDLEFTHAPRT